MFYLSQCTLGTNLASYVPRFSVTHRPKRDLSVQLPYLEFFYFSQLLEVIVLVSN